MPASTVSQTPLVSIVMPVYDPHPVHFREAVDSILRQTMSDWELLIVEDPSPRSAAELLADVDDPRIRHLQRRDKGTLVESLNWGLAESLAPLVARADADDVCEPDRLEKQLAYLQEHPEVDVLGSQLAIIDDEGKPWGYRGYPLHHEAIARGMAISNAVAHPSVLFKKQCVLAAGGYRSFFSEDYELWCRLVHRQAHFANHPEVPCIIGWSPRAFGGPTCGTSCARHSKSRNCIGRTRWVFAADCGCGPRGSCCGCRRGWSSTCS